MLPAFFYGKSENRAGRCLQSAQKEEGMKQNVGGIDRQIRIVLGMVLLFVGVFAPLDTTWKLVLVIVGAVVLITGITGL